MLGRQQMANIPNALHELFKNAHDAYADQVKVDYYRSHGLLVLRDDGVGMTLDDFETRWLTLGTDSKLGAAGSMIPPYADPDKPPRRTLGEKGIGRLAIATIGPQVLILSRPQRFNGLGDLVVSFINWTFFEAPGLNILDVEIPLDSSFPLGRMPDRSLLLRYAQQIRDQVKKMAGRIPTRYFEKINTDIGHFEDSMDEIQVALDELPLDLERGTAFIILPTDPVLEQDIDVPGGEDIPPSLLKTLRGFTNTMTSADTSPVMSATFYDHRRDGTVPELIGAAEFFTPEEFSNADHHFEGEFDEYGQFSGTVQVYRQAPLLYTVPWDGAGGRPSHCGPFRIKAAYLQGNQKESLIPAEEWFRMAEKLNAFGGLYVYRDGIRVLPYGNSDFDWLNIERRRTKKASDWYFSYRRIFGAVELTGELNSALVDKAGREGFRENQAYRQFRSILENLFKQMAMDWFRDGTAKYGEFSREKDEIKRQAELIEKRSKSVRKKREQLKERLDRFWNEVEGGVPLSEADSIHLLLKQRLEMITALPLAEEAPALLNLESELNNKIYELRERFRIPRPRSLSIGKALTRDLERSASVFMRLDEEVFGPLQRDIEELMSAAVADAREMISRRQRILQAIGDRQQRDTRKASQISKVAREDANLLTKEVIDRTRNGLSEVDAAFKAALIDLERTDLLDVDDDHARRFQQILEERLEQVVGREIDNIEQLRDQIQAVLESVREGSSLTETVTILEEQKEMAEETLDRFTDLAQVGAAIGIIQHEFGSTVNSLRKSIRKLQPWVGDNAEASETLSSLRNAFEHLDSYLSMFTPLNRRLYRKALTLTGKIIRNYLMQIFEERISRHKIRIEATPAFNAHSVTAIPATFLPAFINVLDNAIYWLTRDSAGNPRENGGERIVTFDADEDGFLIGNSGPGIPERDADAIFELSFTRKLRGRGMGLAIARKALREEGYDIVLEKAGRDVCPVFRIVTRKEDESR